MSESAAVLFANEAFYRAFADRDLAAMEALWSTTAPVACIHPGWMALVERAEIVESWRRILTGGAAPDIECVEPRAFVLGDAAFVVCYETIGDSVLVATNVFRREGRAWKMVHHQAGPAPGIPAAEEGEPPRAN